MVYITPPNKFDGNYTPIPFGNEKSQNQHTTASLIPLGIWFDIADELIHQRIYTGLLK